MAPFDRPRGRANERSENRRQQSVIERNNQEALTVTAILFDNQRSLVELPHGTPGRLIAHVREGP